ncbi:TPA: AAA family ATPase, partial [Enterococcus faecium]
IHGRNYVTPKDLQDLVPYVFSHRLIFYDRSLKEDEKKQIIHTLVAQIPVPVR